MKSKPIKFSILLLVFCLVNTASAQVMRRIDVGKLQARIFDDGKQSRYYDSWYCSYRRGTYFPFWWYTSVETFIPIEILNRAGTYVGTRNWTDTLGNFWPYHVTGHCNRQTTPNSNTHQFNIPGELSFSIHRYMKYPPTQIVVDRQHLEAPFPLSGDEVAPDKIWGSADIMVECHYRLSNGMDVYQRNLAWSQPGHDDYVIWDLTFINTGNTDADEDIELPGQTLDSVIIMKHYESMPNAGNYPFGSWAGVTENHNSRLSYPQIGDSLRINYIALARKDGHSHDSYGDICEIDWGGDPNLEDGCCWTGHAILFAPKNTSVPQGYPIPDVSASNDPAQPSMHSTIEDFYDVLYDMDDLVDTADHREPYRCMRMGIHGYDDTTGAECTNVYDMNIMYDVYDTTATGAKTYYDQPQDRMGERSLRRGQIFPRNWTYYPFCTNPKFTIGPYNMEFGDTLRFVYAVVAGSIHRKTTYLLSYARANGQARNYDWVSGMDSATIMNEYMARDPVAEIFGPRLPNLIWMDGGLNEIATDYVISTGKDSLFSNGMAAQRNFNMNYEIPVSPAPPSVFEVNSRPDMIELTWRYEPAYEPANLAGFKIFRAEGGTEFGLSDAGVITGDWTLIDSAGPAERFFADTAGLIAGSDYYYYITAVNASGAESGKFLTMTTSPARVTGDFPGERLEDIIIVPNPFNIREEQYDENNYEITFHNVPGDCIIRIFTESGELVTTIQHTDKSGTATWQRLITDSNQRPASGIYIAHIQTPDGRWITRKFIIVR